MWERGPPSNAGKYVNQDSLTKPMEELMWLHL